VRDKLFFFGSYEGLRQRQGLNLNSLVLTDAERTAANDPVIARLIELIPRANLIDSSGAPRFVSSAGAPVTVDQWTVDINYNLGENDRLHGYYALQDSEMNEPNRVGNTIPGFGHVARALRQIFTLNETHTFSQTLVNELRLGFNRFSSSSTPLAQLNPAELGIRNGINEPIGIPQINIAGGSLNFGGPANFPSGRGDTTFIAADTVNWLRGKHSLRLGGEFRQFLNNNFRQTTGSFNFPSVAAFLAGTSNSFSITLGNQSSSIAQPALGFFAQDSYRFHPTLTLELGLRYEWNMTPSERYDRFIVFDPASRLIAAGRKRPRQGLSREQQEHPAAHRLCVVSPRRYHRGPRCLRCLRRPTDDQHCDWFERQSSTRRATHVQRTDSSQRSNRRRWSSRAGAAVDRPRLPKCLHAVVELQRPTRAL
jgi:outer membrane receptor protein involved in Fe transport